MNDPIKSVVKVIGISSGVLAGISLLALTFIAYRNYFEVKKLKLEIKELEKELGMAA